MGKKFLKRPENVLFRTLGKNMKNFRTFQDISGQQQNFRTFQDFSGLWSPCDLSNTSKDLGPFKLHPDGQNLSKLPIL